MRFSSSATDLTTAATDAALGVLCFLLLLRLVRTPVRATWTRAVWSAVFVMLGLGSLLGAIAHGLDLSASLQTALWQPLYLSLGLAVALFLVGGVADWRGERAARALLPWATALAVVFFALTHVPGAGFGVFVAYEAVAMTTTLGIYLVLWRSRRLAGAGIVSLGIALTLAAAVVQLSDWRVQLIWPFDHNGLFHLVQMVAIVVVSSGLRAGMSDGAWR